MIDWVLFIPACFLLNAAPGPNNMLSFSNGAQRGFVTAFLATFGRLPAFALMIVATAVGLGAILSTSAWLFVAVKLVGAAYLVYVGWRMWVSAKHVAYGTGTAQPMWILLRRDFTIAITNPKAIAIFTAFFPQFVQSPETAVEQVLAMGAAFLVLEVLAGALYATAGATLRPFFKSARPFQLLQKCVGGGLIISGFSMALSRRGVAG